MPQVVYPPIRSESGKKWVEASLRDHASIWMYGLLALGFVVRVWHASRTYLNPDEVLHFVAANRPTWANMMRDQASISHPPLLIFILRFWRHLGTSELVLRIPSILAGVVFCWFAYKWFRMLLPEAAAWIAFVFVLFLPSLIDLSTEIRQYALLLAFAMGSAYYLERAFRERSVRLISISGVFLLLAICSHYSSFLFAAAMGLYAIARMIGESPKRVFLATWVGVQAAAIALCTFFYVFHISRMGKLYSATADATHAWMGNEYLGNSYFNPAKINAPLFIIARTGGVFQYALGQAAVGDVAVAIFLLGLVVILRKPQAGKISPRLLGSLMLLPFVMNCASALAGRYPYGGTRHSAFLLPFAMAALGVGVAYLCKFRTAEGLAIAWCVVVFCNVFPSRRLPYISPQDQQRSKMSQAMTFIRQQIPSNEIVFTDEQTGQMLQHYLCDARPMLPLESPQFIEFTCSNHRVIVSRAFLFTPQIFYDRWSAVASEYRLVPGSQVWITQMGWSSFLARDLGKVPGVHISPVYFGERIQFFPLGVGAPMPAIGAGPKA